MKYQCLKIRKKSNFHYLNYVVHFFILFSYKILSSITPVIQSNRVANAWNKLPGEVVHVPSVNSFKAKIDQINETNVKRTRSKF